MEELIRHIEQCSAKAAAAQSDDLAALVSLHTDLLAAREAADGDAYTHGESAPEVNRSIGNIIEMLETIIVCDGDSNDALQSISNDINSLSALVIKTRVSSAAEATPSEGNSCPSADEHAISENDASLSLDFVGEAEGHLQTAELSLLQLEKDPGDSNVINAAFRAFHTIKGSAGFLGIKHVVTLAHSAETLLDTGRAGEITLAGGALDLLLETRDLMARMVQNVKSAAQARSAPSPHPDFSELLHRLESAGNAAGTPAAMPSPKKTLAPAASEIDAPDTDGAALPAVANSGESEGIIKVATGRLDALIDAVGELVIVGAMVTRDLTATEAAGDQRLARNLSHLSKISRGLQELSMSMRMVPIAGVFQKMARLTRDVSRKIGKEIDFVQVGGETELDRNVVEAISDPLIHMVRNSIDHGVEFPDDREKAGKPRGGRVVLKACHQAGQVVVEISDDGRGLQQSRIVQKAIAAGIIQQGQDLSEQQIFQLIFHPGLSTAEKITDLSGRGVGMDVVRKNIEALRGRIDIASSPGRGSTFTVRFPLTLAVIDGLIARVGAERYIIPLSSIEQCVRPEAKQLSSVKGQGELCMIRDRLLQVVRLHELFHVEPTTKDPTQALVVVVRDGPDCCCILVDELVGQQQVVIKSLGEGVGHVPGVSGCAILGDGKVSLILDVAGIIHTALA